MVRKIEEKCFLKFVLEFLAHIFKIVFKHFYFCQIQLCIPAMHDTTRFFLVWLFLRRTMSTQHWSSVET